MRVDVRKCLFHALLVSLTLAGRKPARQRYSVRGEDPFDGFEISRVEAGVFENAVTKVVFGGNPPTKLIYTFRVGDPCPVIELGR